LLRLTNDTAYTSKHEQVHPPASMRLSMQSVRRGPGQSGTGRRVSATVCNILSAAFDTAALPLLSYGVPAAATGRRWV